MYLLNIGVAVITGVINNLNAKHKNYGAYLIACHFLLNITFIYIKMYAVKGK